MANLHQAFLDFNDSIRLDSSHQDSLRTSRNAVRDKIRKFFAAKDLDIAPKFHGQGSFMMNTIITDLISGSSCRVYGKNPTLNNRKVSFFCVFSGFFVASSTYTEIRNTGDVYLQKYVSEVPEERC